MWPLVGKVLVAVGTGLVIEYGDDVAKAVGDFFDNKPRTKLKPVTEESKLMARETLAQVKANGLPDFTESQARSLMAIASVCNVLKIFTIDQRRAICMALWVNAWHESRLRTHARNPKGEDSRGLFQINVRAHPYWKKIDLYNPTKNTAAILILALKQEKFVEAVNQGSLSKLVYVVCRYVERPRNPHEAALRRVKTAQAWFGKAAN